MPLLEAYPKRLLDQQRVIAEITVFANRISGLS
jgi:hypothetical protein